MKNVILLASVFIGLNSLAQTKPIVKPKEVQVVTNSKKELDKASIKSMVGIYKVSFDFAETFAPDTAYKYHKRYSEWEIDSSFDGNNLCFYISSNNFSNIRNCRSLHITTLFTMIVSQLKQRFK